MCNQPHSAGTCGPHSTAQAGGQTEKSPRACTGASWSFIWLGLHFCEIGTAPSTRRGLTRWCSRDRQRRHCKPHQAGMVRAAADAGRQTRCRWCRRTVGREAVPVNAKEHLLGERLRPSSKLQPSFSVKSRFAMRDAPVQSRRSWGCCRSARTTAACQHHLKAVMEVFKDTKSHENRPVDEPMMGIH